MYISALTVVTSQHLFPFSTLLCLKYYSNSRGCCVKAAEFKYINMNLKIFPMALQAWLHPVKGIKAICLHHKCEGK